MPWVLKETFNIQEKNGIITYVIFVTKLYHQILKMTSVPTRNRYQTSILQSNVFFSTYFVFL